MACSKTCKVALAVFIAVAALSLLILVVLYNIYLSNENSKLCENEDELYYEDTNSCYTKGLQGPCNETLVLLEKKAKSSFGVCSCAYTENPRALLYHRETYKCYFIFSRGFCKPGFWLNVSRNGVPVCEENRCLIQLSNSDAAPEDIVPLEGGKCAILNQPAAGCRENETVRFYHRLIYPSCSKKKLNKSNIGHIPQNCPLGSYLNVLGKCQPQIDVDFN